MKIKNVSLLFVILFLMTSCLVKPPAGNEELGAEVSATEVEKALTDAQAGLSLDKSFRVGDTGTVILYMAIPGQTVQQESHIETVISKDATNGVIYTDDWTIYGTSSQSHGSTKYQIPPPSPSASPSPSPSGVAQLKNRILPVPVLKFVSKIKNTVIKWASRITIQPSTALGESEQPQQQLHKSVADIEIEMALELAAKHLSSLGKVNSLDVAALSPTASPSPSASPSSSASASPAPSPTVTPIPTAAPIAKGAVSHYYGLAVTQVQYKTTNCAQYTSCFVPTTHIEFKEVKTVAGVSTKYYWSYDISTDVPGLFIVLRECAAQVANETTPLKSCVEVSNFTLGAG